VSLPLQEEEQGQRHFCLRLIQVVIRPGSEELPEAPEIAFFFRRPLRCKLHKVQAAFAIELHDEPRVPSSRGPNATASTGRIIAASAVKGFLTFRRRTVQSTAARQFRFGPSDAVARCPRSRRLGRSSLAGRPVPFTRASSPRWPLKHHRAAMPLASERSDPLLESGHGVKVGARPKQPASENWVAGRLTSAWS
jgi:hypothetical protein